MVNKNELRKNITTAAVILFASTVFATAPVNRVYAQEPVVQNIEALAAPVETEKWSSAKVYANARYGQTWSGGNEWFSALSWEWLNDMNYCFKSVSAVTANGTPLNYQWLIPIDMDCIGQYDADITYTDNNEPIRKCFIVSQPGTVDPGDTLWTYMDHFVPFIVNSYNAIAVGDVYMDTQEDDNYARLTMNVTKINTAYNTVEKGYVTTIWQKSTDKILQAAYFEQEGYYDDTRALTVIYSFLPTGL